jgi:SSS family solute:Na+ symporter
MNQMGLTAIGTMILIIIISYQKGKGEDDPKGIQLDKGLFSTSPIFNISAFIICILTSVLYAIFW